MTKYICIEPFGTLKEGDVCHVIGVVAGLTSLKNERGEGVIINTRDLPRKFKVVKG